VLVGGAQTLTFKTNQLGGTIIGTPGSYNNFGDVKEHAMDWDLTTFFDTPSSTGGSNCWVGLDFGSGISNVITQINYAPRSNIPARMVGGFFQGANDPGFTNAVTLFTVAAQPTAGVLTAQAISNTNAFRYVRYLSPVAGWGNVAEVEFYGYAPVSTTPVRLGMSFGGNQIQFSWPPDHIGWRLQTQTNLPGTNWVAVPGANATNLILIPMNINSAFFRLVYP